MGNFIVKTGTVFLSRLLGKIQIFTLYNMLQAYDPKRISKSPYRMHVTSIPPIFPHKVIFSLKNDIMISLLKEMNATYTQVKVMKP